MGKGMFQKFQEAYFWPWLKLIFRLQNLCGVETFLFDRTMRQILNGLDLHLQTDRLILEPINENHARDMVGLLSDRALHTFVPSDPPTEEKLKAQYKYWELRISPQEDELWLNWIGRLKTTGEVVGHFQAGVKESLDCNIAYTIGTKFQRQGLAHEGLAEILTFLFNKVDAQTLKAWIDTRNFASIELVKKLGLTQTEFIAKADHFKGADSDESLFSLDRPTWVSHTSIKKTP